MPPDFYLDENVNTRSIRRVLTELQYRFRTVNELYGTREAALGAPDEEWLRLVGERSWAVLTRDAQILRRPNEVAAFRRYRVHMFLLPGEARRDDLVKTVEINITAMCDAWTVSPPGAWRATMNGLREVDFES